MKEIAKLIIAVFFGCPGRGEKNGKLKKYSGCTVLWHGDI
jgi:hypothetical protein